VQNDKLLEVRDLRTSFFTMYGEVQAVRNVSFDVNRKEIVGIVGESGSGKSVTVLSIVQLLQEPGKIVSGSINFEGEDLLKKNSREMRKIRNNRIAMVFQDPMTSLNPTLTVGLQIAERLRAFNRQIGKKEARAQAVELLNMVKIPEPEKRLMSYPFELSGGMRQRVMFAIAIACKPRLLIADEPTTALDVTIQNQVLHLIKNLKDEIDSSVILVTHDLGVVAETCQRVVVMYGGMIMEEGMVEEIFHNTAHPYTIGLKKSIPQLDRTDGSRLFSIPGSPPSLLNPPKGCPFVSRCNHAMHICMREKPPYFALSDTHRSMCWLLEKECPNKALKGVTI